MHENFGQDHMTAIIARVGQMQSGLQFLGKRMCRVLVCRLFVCCPHTVKTITVCCTFLCMYTREHNILRYLYSQDNPANTTEPQNVCVQWRIANWDLVPLRLHITSFARTSCSHYCRRLYLARGRPRHYARSGLH